jgi:hypothetical protein
VRDAAGGDFLVLFVEQGLRGKPAARFVEKVRPLKNGFAASQNLFR